MIDLKRLKELATVATQGEWFATHIHDGEEILSAAVSGPDDEFLGTLRFRSDAEFIAAANPATVLALIEELERKRHD